MQDYKFGFMQCRVEKLGLGRAEDAWTKCLTKERCVKSIWQLGKRCSVRI